MLWRDTDPDSEAVLLRLLRRAPGAERVAFANRLTATVIELSRRALRREHPELSELEVLVKWVGLHYGKELEAGVRDELRRRGRM